MTVGKYHDAYLGLGSNLGDKKNNLRLALEALKEKTGKIIGISSFHETAPVDFKSDNTFLNAACHIRTTLTPRELLIETQKIEKQLGRNKKSVDGSYSDRTIDIDILLYDDIIIDETDLVIPHPHMHKRKFVILPLAEIAKEVVHPTLLKTIEEIKGNLN